MQKYSFYCHKTPFICLNFTLKNNLVQKIAIKQKIQYALQGKKKQTKTPPNIQYLNVFSWANKMIVIDRRKYKHTQRGVSNGIYCTQNKISVLLAIRAIIKILSSVEFFNKNNKKNAIKIFTKLPSAHQCDSICH